MPSLASALLTTLLLPFGAFAVAAPGATAQVAGSLTIRATACPPGYERDDHAADCADAPLAGVAFAYGALGGPGMPATIFAEGTTGDDGGVVFRIPAAATPSPLWGDQRMPAGYHGFEAVCTRNGEAIPVERTQFEPSGPFGIVVAGILPGDALACAWYTVPGVDDAAPEIASGGIGLSRAAWEAAHGPSELVSLPPTGKDPDGFGSVYAYEDGTYYVQFGGRKGEAGRVSYVEVAWGSGGVGDQEAHHVVDELLPDDAAETESYRLPPTPGGPMALLVRRYESVALDAVPTGDSTDTAHGVPSGWLGLGPAVLVTYHVRVNELTPGEPSGNRTTVTRATITVA